MADPLAKRCAACGAEGEFHEHHLVPRGDGGKKLPTVLLCVACHELVHDYKFVPTHRELTIRGLERAKANGKKLGGLRRTSGGIPADLAAAGRAAQSARAQRRAEDMRPYVEAAQAAGAASLRQIGAALTARGIAPPSGGDQWHPAQVRRVLRRIEPTCQNRPCG